MSANDDQPRSKRARAAASTRRAEADRLFFEAIALHEERTEDAMALYRRAARLGDVAAQTALGGLLMQMGDPHRAEGRRRLRRSAQAGDPTAAWNLAIEYRLAGDRRWYLHWLRVAAQLGDQDAVPLLAEIDRRIATGRPWTMVFLLEIDASDIAYMLEAYRDGRVTAPELAVWADDAVGLRSALALDPARRTELAVILRELADPTRLITRKRASEILFRLGY